MPEKAKYVNSYSGQLRVEGKGQGGKWGELFRDPSFSSSSGGHKVWSGLVLWGGDTGSGVVCNCGLLGESILWEP